MTELEDARARAESIMDRVEQLAIYVHDDEERQRRDASDQWIEFREAVMDVLAAAIRIDEATEGGAMVESDMQPLFEWLHEMLSRLQEGRT